MSLRRRGTCSASINCPPSPAHRKHQAIRNEKDIARPSADMHRETKRRHYILEVRWDYDHKSASSLQNGLDGLEMCSRCRSSLSQRPLRTRCCHLRSSASAICSDWHSTGSACVDCNWTTKFCRQRTSNMEPSATSTTVTGPVGERLRANTEDAPVLDRSVPLRRLHHSGVNFRGLARVAIQGLTWVNF